MVIWLGKMPDLLLCCQSIMVVLLFLPSSSLVGGSKLNWCVGHDNIEYMQTNCPVDKSISCYALINDGISDRGTTILNVRCLGWGFFKKGEWAFTWAWAFTYNPESAHGCQNYPCCWFTWSASTQKVVTLYMHTALGCSQDVGKLLVLTAEQNLVKSWCIYVSIPLLIY